MVVLNIYSKISTICLSKKLGLYIGNLPKEKINNWNNELYNVMHKSQKKVIEDQKKTRFYKNFNIYDFAKIVIPNENLSNISEKQIIHMLVDNMICIYFDYEYVDMPVGNWETNCFDGRLCEEDYAEKIVDFINFAYDILNYSNKIHIQWIYSSNYDFHNHYQIFWYNKDSESGIDTLKQWGILFDNFLQYKNDYLELDYLINSIHKDNSYNEYHLFKLFSLCQLFLEKQNELELDWKLPQFLDNRYSYEDRKELSIILRKMRNKIAHGDFIKLENTIEEYAKRFMDEKYNFDYSEHSRKNWVILNSCCLLQEAVVKILKMMFYNKKNLLKIKNLKNQTTD